MKEGLIQAMESIKTKLSNGFDKDAAALCDAVKKLAEKAGLKVFVVCYNPKTEDGASFTSDTGSAGSENPVVYARRAHTDWEIANGLNPDHERTKDN